MKTVSGNISLSRDGLTHYNSNLEVVWLSDCLH